MLGIISPTEMALTMKAEAASTPMKARFMSAIDNAR
jgi:hypothetical protein